VRPPEPSFVLTEEGPLQQFTTPPSEQATITPQGKVPSRGPTRLSTHATFARGALSVKISCPAAKLSCAGTVEVETAAAFPASAGSTARAAKRKAKASRLVLGQARFSLAGGASRAVSVPLSARGATLLKKLRRLPLLVLVAARDPLGDPGLTTVHLTAAEPPASKR